MISPKHTPGPWVCELDEQTNGAYIYPKERTDGHAIATVYRHADAHIIAHAPQMLEILQFVDNVCFMIRKGDSEAISHLETHVRAAISNALGRSK